MTLLQLFTDSKRLIDLQDEMTLASGLMKRIKEGYIDVPRANDYVPQPLHSSNKDVSWLTVYDYRRETFGVANEPKEGLVYYDNIFVWQPTYPATLRLLSMRSSPPIQSWVSLWGDEKKEHDIWSRSVNTVSFVPVVYSRRNENLSALDLPYLFTQEPEKLLDLQRFFENVRNGMSKLPEMPKDIREFIEDLEKKG